MRQICLCFCFYQSVTIYQNFLVHVESDAKINWFLGGESAFLALVYDSLFSNGEIEIIDLFESCYLQPSLILYPQLWYFLVRQVIFNKLFLQNENPWRIFWYLLRKLNWESAELIKSIFLCPYSEKKIIFWKIRIFVPEDWLWLFKMSKVWDVSINLSYKIWTNDSLDAKTH